MMPMSEVPNPDTRRADAKAFIKKTWPGARTHDAPMELWIALDDIRRAQPHGRTKAQMDALA